MRTARVALAAMRRLEQAAIELADASAWWDSKSPEFQKQYVKVHPHSKYAHQYKAAQRKNPAAEEIRKKKRKQKIKKQLFGLMQRAGLPEAIADITFSMFGPLGRDLKKAFGTEEKLQRYFEKHSELVKRGKKYVDKKDKKATAPRAGKDASKLNKKDTNKPITKLSSKDSDFGVKAAAAVKKLVHTPQDKVNPKQLHHVDDVLTKHQDALSKKKDRADNVIRALEAKLKKAPKDQHSSLKKEIKTATSYSNKLGKGIANLEDKRSMLRQAHPKELKKKHALHKLNTKVKSIREKIIKENAAYRKLAEKKSLLVKKAKLVKGEARKKYAAQVKEIREQMVEAKERIAHLKRLLSST